MDIHLAGDPTTELLAALKRHTAAHHTRAERAGIVASLLRGQASVFGYALLLRNLLPAYRRMEAALDALPAGHALSGLARREVYRVPALCGDLARLAGPGWAKRLPVLAAARRYAGLVARAAYAPDGGRLVAHVYVRYFGDLSGGQILRRQLGRSLGLADSSLAFYIFPEIADIDGFKAEYRAAIEKIGRGMRDIAPVLDEAGAVFEANIEVSEAVARYVARHPAAA